MKPNFKKIMDSFTTRLVLMAILIGLGVTLVISSSLILWLTGTLILGFMFAHAVELQHQCLHYTAFRTRSFNRVVGIALGLPTLTSFHAYRRSHLAHHRYLGTSQDSTFFVYKFLEKRTFKNFIADLFGVSHLKSSLLAIVFSNDSRLMDLKTFDCTETKESERFDYGLMGFMVVCAILMGTVFGYGLVLKIWILPLILVAQPVHFLIELPEHIGCFVHTPDVFLNTRTIKGSKFSRWLTNFNNLHVEHHLDASVPMTELPLLLNQYQGEHRFICETYIQFYLMLFQSTPTKNKYYQSSNSERSVV